MHTIKAMAKCSLWDSDFYYGVDCYSNDEDISQIIYEDNNEDNELDTTFAGHEKIEQICLGLAQLEWCPGRNTCWFSSGYKW